MKSFASLALVVALFSATSAFAQGTAKFELDAVLRVKVANDLQIDCQFELPGTKDQSFENTEYRYAVLDSNGVQVKDAVLMRLPIRVISLPKSQRSVSDKTDAIIQKGKLTSGETYFFVVSVRHLTGLARFMAP